VSLLQVSCCCLLIVTMICCVSQGQREESSVDEGLAAKEAQELYDVRVVCVFKASVKLALCVCMHLCMRE